MSVTMLTIGKLTFFATVLCFAGAASVGAQSVPGRKAAKIGMLHGGTPSSPSIMIESFKQTLREKGWNEGRNLTLERRYAEGHYERLPGLARELVAQGVDVIVTDGSAQTSAAIQVTKTVPIVMATSGDPVGSGFVKSLARPGGNVTGASFFFPELTAKRLELLKEAVPSAARVGIIYNPLNPVQEPAVVAAEATGKRLKVRIERLAARAPADFDAIFPVMTKERMDAVIVLEDGTINSQALRLVDATLRGNVPTIFGLSNVVAAGGFMSYAPDRAELWRHAALLTDKILRGAKPGDLPVEQPTKFDLVINMKTAKALGLRIPSSLLLRADQLIEQ
jgi:putative ABC transport system substrate-binding protein